MRWANWKQFYTNGAMPMLNMMGDGGPLVAKAWDEALATMAMCEEATFVFGVKEVRLRKEGMGGQHRRWGDV
jgi:hypothetical protein